MLAVAGVPAKPGRDRSDRVGIGRRNQLWDTWSVVGGREPCQSNPWNQAHGQAKGWGVPSSTDGQFSGDRHALPTALG
jgi:hypothetical protein